MSYVTALVVVAALSVQVSPRVEGLVAAVRPLLPYPAATAAGDLPVDNSADARWFVVWPRERDDTRIIVRANPLHPEVQKVSAAAMEEINAAVAAAERRAQASYDRALEQLRKSGKAGELENVSLDDEGIAGQRIDAELEVIIELVGVSPFDLASAEAPIVQPGVNGAAWIVTVPANTYRPEAGDDRRERFRAAEAHIYFGVPPPAVTRQRDQPLFRVAVTPSPKAFAVVIRGNAELVEKLARDSDWAKLASR